MFGWGYVKETCMSLFQREQKKDVVNIYYAECLRIIAENTAKIAMIDSGGKAEAAYMSAKLYDILHPKKIDTRTADDIIEGIRKKLK